MVCLPGVVLLGAGDPKNTASASKCLWLACDCAALRKL